LDFRGYVYSANIGLEEVMRFLIDLPNQEGFKFIGVTHDGEELNCVVMKNPSGCHSVYDDRGTPVFLELQGWKLNQTTGQFCRRKG